MGKIVPDWQTFINCIGGSLTIRHLKDGLAENLEIPWPKKLKSITCEQVWFRLEDFQPLSQYGESLNSVDLKKCKIGLEALSVLSKAPYLQCLVIENCDVSDDDFKWFKGTAKLNILSLVGNSKCTSDILRKAVGSPLVSLYLRGTSVQDSDIPLILSFPELRYLDLSETKVTGAALPQLAVNRGLTIICDHDQEGVSQFRTSQRQNWKKKITYDEKLAKEPIQLVKNFYSASQDRRQPRSHFVTDRYQDYCKSHGYNGVDPWQKVSICSSNTPPYQNFRVVDVEQITRKKFYVYSECNDEFLSQYRCLVVQLDDSWKIDKNERLMDGKWKFWRLD